MLKTLQSDDGWLVGYPNRLVSPQRAKSRLNRKAVAGRDRLLEYRLLE